MNSFRYQQTKFGGIRQDAVDGYHAFDSLNMLTDYGKVRKRKGYRQTLSFDGAVRTVKDVVLEGIEYRLIYAGKRFWLRALSDPDEQRNYTDVTLSGNTNRVDVDRLEDRPAQVYCNGGKAYVVGCGDYLVLSLVDGKPELRRVEDEASTYVPTTRIGISALGEATYVEQTVDEDSVGDWWVQTQGGGYESVHLDEEHPPESGVTYYRRIVTESQGVALDKPNLMSTYRINTLHGAGEDPSEYRLDVPSIDRDGEVTVTVKVPVGEDVRTYVLTESDGEEQERTLRKGDDLTGKTLNVAAATTTAGTLHLLPSRHGITVVLFEHGAIEWQAEGVTSHAWNNASLVVHTPLGDTTIATATRESWMSAYAVTYTSCQVSMGNIGAVINITDDPRLTAMLPSLVSDLTYQSTVMGSINYLTARLSLTMDTTPPDSYDNITVKFRYRPPKYNASLIQNALHSCVWGMDGRQDRLFVADGERAIDYHSASGDWTYFADTDTTALGEGRIVGYLPINDSTLATFTDAKTGHNLFVRKGSWQESKIEVGDYVNTVYSALFPVVGSMRVLTPYQVGYADFGTHRVFASADGVYSLAYNAQNEEGKTRLRGKFDLAQAHACIVHGGRYFLSDGIQVYSLDSRLTYGDKGDTLYELSRLDIPDVSCWFARGDTLGFGTLDGRVCTVEEDYNDVTFEPLTAGYITLDENNHAVIDPALAPPEASKLLLATDAYYPLATGEIASGVLYLTAADVDCVYEGDIVYLGSGYTPYTVGAVDWAKCTVTLACDSTPQDGLVTVYGNAKGIRLSWLRQGNVLSFIRSDGKAVNLCHLSGVATGRWEVTLPVKAYWASQSMDLGKGDLAKILQRLSVVYRTADRGSASISITNGSTIERYALKGMGRLDISDFNMERMTYEGDFWQSHMIRLKMRCHHLVCRLSSDAPCPWELGSLSIMGIIPDKQRGGVNG